MQNFYASTQLTNAPVSLAILSAVLAVLAVLAFRNIRRKLPRDGSGGQTVRERGPRGRRFQE